MPHRGRRKKRRTHVPEETQAANALISQEHLKVPKSVVIHRGHVSPVIQDLIHDLRRTLLPHTAMHLRANAKNRLKLKEYSKQFTSHFGVTHILCLSQTASNVFFRVARTPVGPTLSFNVRGYSLMRAVRSIQRRPYESDRLYRDSPIVVTNNFGDSASTQTVEPHVKLMRITFQNMFPAVNVASVKLSSCRRVVLFDYMKEDGEVEIRHYAIRATPVGMTRRVRRLVQSKIPNLGQLDDVADYLMGYGTGNVSDASDSEMEDETCQVVLPQNYNGRGNTKSSKSALKLVELGPRMRLKLVKVERGLGEGDVMYHAFVHKTEKEKQELKERIEKRELEKRRRREEQDRNVERKLKAQEEKKERKKKRQEERAKMAMDELRGMKDVEKQEEEGTSEDESDDNESESDDDSV
eukprot:CAMPEP_0172502148 /NCGR_PEP_ID=MMETSP1066-20121228/157091_1 /TAXON_ID=671091 /ORGANISM="Coscinodiscus wailesii, Strain CCMP2513" /LENGTH=409 /DNA_ID=CAMNT_0013277301 /DNA_START=15 /DNA_END=1244 /DNA_ORIENTATION=+